MNQQSIDVSAAPAERPSSGFGALVLTEDASLADSPQAVGGSVEAKRLRSRAFRLSALDASERKEDAELDELEDVALPELPKLGATGARWVGPARGGGGGDSDGEGDDKPLGSNHGIPAAQSLAYRLSIGYIVGCDCCLEAYASAWYSRAHQRRVKRVAVALLRGWLDCEDSHAGALGAVLMCAGASGGGAAAAAGAALFSLGGAEPPAYALGVTPAGHAAVREFLLRELGRGRLVAEVDPEARTVAVLVASDWEREEWEKSHKECGEKRVKLARAAATRSGGGGGGMEADHETPPPPLSSPPAFGAGSGHLKRPRRSGEEGAPAPHARALASVHKWMMGGVACGGVPPHWVAALAAAAPLRPCYRIVLYDVFSVLPAPVAQEAPPFVDVPPRARTGCCWGSQAAAAAASKTHTTALAAAATAGGGSAGAASCSPDGGGGVALSVATTSPVAASVAPAAAPCGGGAPLFEGGGRAAHCAARGVSPPRARRAPRPRAATSPFSEADAYELLLRVRYVAPYFKDAGGERGRRIFAGGFIPRGAAVCEYSGQLVRGAEGNEREDRYDKEGGAAYGCYSYFFTHPGTREAHCVDATAERRVYGVGRLLSHAARAPNTAAKIVFVDGVPRLLFIAKTNVPFGTELLFDYGDRREDALKSFTWLRE